MARLMISDETRRELGIAEDGGVQAPVAPAVRWSITQIKAANKAGGGGFFVASVGNVRRKGVLPTVYQGAGGVFFLTREVFKSQVLGFEETSYRVWEFEPEGGRVNLARVQGFLERAEARGYAKGRAQAQGKKEAR